MSRENIFLKQDESSIHRFTKELSAKLPELSDKLPTVKDITEVDILVSWNFKHIVHFDKIMLFNAVNIELGFKPLKIYSPREVTTYEQN